MTKQKSVKAVARKFLVRYYQ